MHLALSLIHELRFSKPHAKCSARRKDLSSDEVVVRLAGYLFNYPPEDIIAEVGIRVAGAGIELKRLSEHVSDDGLGGGRRRLSDRHSRLSRAEHWVERGIAIPAARML